MKDKHIKFTIFILSVQIDIKIPFEFGDLSRKDVQSNYQKYYSQCNT